MQITSIIQTITINIIKRLLLFVVLISFSISTIEKTNVNLNLDRDNILEKINSGDLSFLKDEDYFPIFTSIIEDEKNRIIHKESLEGFDESLISKLVFEIYNNIDTPNYENISIKKTNEILDTFIRNISKISELNIYNNFFNITILDLLFIYCNNKNDNLNFENFNEKIIPIINKILLKEVIKCKKDINNFTKNSFMKKCNNVYQVMSKNESFFLNLSKNIELKKLFINIFDEYISFLIIEKNFFKISNFINNYFNKLVFGFIEKNYSSKKIFLKLIDCFFECFRENLNFKYITYLNFYSSKYLNFDVIKDFLNNLFKNRLYLDNTTDLDILINIFKKIADIELYLVENKVNKISLYAIEFYIEYIATIQEKYKEKNSELIEIFEKNIYKILILISSFEIDKKNLDYFYNSYNLVENFLYYSSINFKISNFTRNIEYTLQKCNWKIFMFDLNKIGYKVAEFSKNDIISNFLSMDLIELEKYDFKNIISNKVIKMIKQFNEKYENLEYSEYINLTFTEKNLLEFAYLYDLLNMNEVANINYVIKFLKNYKNSISKSIDNYKEVEFYIILSFFTTNLLKKLDMDEISKNDYLEKVKKLTFETEIQEFIIKRT